jgi:hypothetical protein
MNGTNRLSLQISGASIARPSRQPAIGFMLQRVHHDACTNDSYRASAMPPTPFRCWLIRLLFSAAADAVAVDVCLH